MKKNSGFTIIELLVVISIMVLFIGATLAQYNNYTQQLKLKNEAKKLVDVIELAKKKALTSDLQDKNCISFTGYRITTSAGAYSLLFGCNAVYTLIQNYNLSTNITITASGRGNFDFPPLMQNINFNINSIQIKNTGINGNNQCVTISVSPIGIVDLNETLINC